MVSKEKVFKGKYEAKVEFPEGWGGVGGPNQKVFHGGYFLKQHHPLCIKVSVNPKNNK